MWYKSSSFPISYAELIFIRYYPSSFALAHSVPLYYGAFSTSLKGSHAVSFSQVLARTADCTSLVSSPGFLYSR